MERLAPSLLNLSNLSLEKAANTEYPFFAEVPDGFQIYAPSAHFTDADSGTYFGTAYRLLSGLPNPFPEIVGWNVTLCDPL